MSRVNQLFLARNLFWMVTRVEIRSDETRRAIGVAIKILGKATQKAVPQACIHAEKNRPLSPLPVKVRTSEIMADIITT
nr:hypothetical protein [Pseudomaricurvus alkylphenolicus]